MDVDLEMKTISFRSNWQIFQCIFTMTEGNLLTMRKVIPYQEMLA